MPDSRDSTADGEVERLRERLAYYESFDQLIQKSVSDANDILREAIAMREQAVREPAELASQVKLSRQLQLQSFRSLFAEMLDDITLLQGQAERLARRLSDAIDALEAELQPEAEFPALPESLLYEMESAIDDAIEHGVIDETTELPEIAIEQSEGHEELPQSPSPADGENTASQIESGGGRFVLLAHGVPKAATALSLKSYLEGLDIVTGIEPREFAAGVLRLQLEVERELQAGDLDGWTLGGTITVVHEQPGLLEVKLD